MKKSIFLLLFIFILFIIGNVNAEEENLILIGCNDQNECGYNLDSDNLPNTITWKNEENEIILNNYIGSPISIISENEITIKLENKNIININSDLNYGIRSLNKLIIDSYNNGILEIINDEKNEGNINGITGDNIILRDGIVNIFLKGNYNYKGIVCNNLTVTNNSKLNINIDTNSIENNYGVYNETSFLIDTLNSVKIILNESENNYVSNNISYNEDNYIKFEDDLNKNYFYIIYKTISNINIETEYGEINVPEKEESGKKITIEIVPDEHFELLSLNIYDNNNKDVTKEIDYNEEDNTFIMPSYEITIKAVFTKIKYNIHKDLLYTGRFEVQKQGVYEERVKIDIYPNTGYKIKNVNIKNSFTGTIINEIVNYNEENNTFVMPDYDITITVNLEEKTYKITAITSDTGTFTVNKLSDEVQEIKYKSKVEITDLKPKESYSVIGYNVEIKDKDNNDITDSLNYNKINNTFIMPYYDISIKITFLKSNYMITTKGENGIIETQKYVNKDDIVTIKSIPKEGYILKNIEFYDYLRPSIKLDIKLNVSNYTFTMPNKFIIINGIFVKKPSMPKVITNLYGYDDVKITWNKIKDVDGYYLYYKKSTEKAYTYIGKTTKNEYKKINLYDGKKYNFKIKAYTKDIKNNEYQSYSVSSIYTLKKIETPKVLKYSKNYIRVRWKDIDGESGYQISKSIYKNKTNVIKTTNKNYSSYILKVLRNKKYYYKIRAYKTENNKKIYGPWSNTKYYKLI